MTVNAGTLCLGDIGAAGTNSIALIGGTLQLNVANGVFTNEIAVDDHQSDETVNIDSNGNAVTLGQITGGNATHSTLVIKNSVNSADAITTNATANTYIGKIVLGDGSNTDNIIAGAVDTFKSAASVQLATGSVFNVDGKDQELTVAATNAGGIINNHTTDSAVVTLNQATAAEISGVIDKGTGDLSLVKTGAGALTLSGANTYTLGTTLKEGTLIAGSVDAFGTGAVTMQDGTTLTTTAARGLANKVIVDSGAEVVIDNAAQELTLSGGIAGGSADSVITFLGDNTSNGFTIAKQDTTNAYAGNIVIGDGTDPTTLKAGAADAFKASASMDIQATSVFDIDGTNQQINNITGSGIVTNNNAGADAAVVLNNTDNTEFAGKFVNGSSAQTISGITKQGVGTLTLTGDSSGYAGPVTVAEGGMVINNDGGVNTEGALGGVVTVQDQAWIYGQRGQVGELVQESGSTFYADSAADGTYNGLQFINNGTFSFADGAIVDMDGISKGSLQAFGAGFGGFTTADDLTRFNTALNATDYVFYGYKANAAGDLIVSDYLNRARISDVYVNSLLMHDNAAIRKASTDRITQNFMYWNDPCVKKRCPSGNSIWVNYVGRKNKLESSYNGRDADFESNGVQLGVDLFSNRCTQFGVMFGFEKEKDDLDVYRGNTRFTDNVEADDYYIGFYGARLFSNCMDLRGFAGYGHQSYDYVRYGRYNNLATRHNGSYDGDTFEATVELGRRFYVNNRFSFRPVVGLDFYTNSIDAMQEYGNGVDYDYKFGKASLTQLFARFGSDVQWTRGRLNINGGAYYSYQFDGNGDTLRTQISRDIGGGVTQSGWMYGSDLGNSVITLSVGANYYLNQKQTWSVFGNYYGDFYTDRDGDPISNTFVVGTQFRF